MAEHNPMFEALTKLSSTAEVAAAEHELAALHAEIACAQADLDVVRRDLAGVRRALTRSRGAQLVEANENLVLAALEAQTQVEDVRSDLDMLTDASQRDSLTGVPNRVLMMDRLRTAIAHAARHRTRLALLFFDLDQFKSINDTRGHAVGDFVLQQFAACLCSVVRQSDTVSRLGGDEFLVLLHEVADQSDAGLVAAKILWAMREPGRFGDTDIHLTASIGIAMYPDDGTHAAALIDLADAAMYKAKQAGGGKHQFQAAPFALP